MATTDPRLSIQISAAFSQRALPIGFDTGYSKSDSFTPAATILQPSAAKQALFDDSVDSITPYDLTIDGATLLGYVLITNSSESDSNIVYLPSSHTIPIGGAAVFPVFLAGVHTVQIQATSGNCDFKAAVFSAT